MKKSKFNETTILAILKEPEPCFTASGQNAEFLGSHLLITPKYRQE